MSEMKHKKKRGNLAFLIIILLLVLVFLYSGLRVLESTVFNRDQEIEQDVPSKTIVRDGVEYFPRQDITVILLKQVAMAKT